MIFPRARLIVSACLFVGWLGFLSYLVVYARTVVLSKPQFMIAQAYVVVEVSDGDRSATWPAPNVIVKEVLWSADSAGRQLAGKPLHLADLSACVKEHGYHGEGQYLLPLVRSVEVPWSIAPVARVDYFKQQPTHGTVEAFGLFSHRVYRRLPIVKAQQLRTGLEETGFKTALLKEELRIYPWTPDTRVQVDRIVAAKR